MNPLATPANVTALDRAAELIENPYRWCSGALARDEYGNPVNWSSPTAVRWCAAGAIAFEAAGDPLWKLTCAADDIALALYGDAILHVEHDPLSAVNDRLGGRIPAIHVIRSLAAELRSDLP